MEVQTFCNLFPGSGVTILYRNALLNPILEHINVEISGIDKGLFVKSIKEIFVFDSYLFGKEIGIIGILLEIGIIAIISIIMIMLVYPKVYQRK